MAKPVFICILQTHSCFCATFWAFWHLEAILKLFPFFCCFYWKYLLLIWRCILQLVLLVKTQNKYYEIQFLNCFWSVPEKSCEGSGWGRLSTPFGLRKLVYIVYFMKAAWILEHYSGSSTSWELQLNFKQNCKLIFLITTSFPGYHSSSQSCSLGFYS